MRSEWRDCTLGQFVRLQRGHDLTASEQQPGTVPVIGSAGPNGLHSEARAKAPGVIIGRSGASIGRVHFSSVDYWPHNTSLYVTDFLGNDPRFAYYLLKTLDLAGYNSGSAQPSLNRNYIYKMKLRIPGLEEQQQIAETLQSIDDRIDLLRQTNATLESIAQALFKSWFIDFDPVRAKAEGREPEGMDAATAALFPAEFEESAMGLIPKGWSISSIGEHVVAERGLSYKGAGLCGPDEGLPMHNLNSVLEGGDYKYAGIKYYAGDYKERHIALEGDVIVANTEQGHEHRLIGFPAIVPTRYTRAIYSHHLYRVRINPESALTTHMLYYTLMAPTVREQVIGCANGSTVNMLKKAGLEIPWFVCPTADTSRAFEELATPLRRQKEANVERSDVFSALRDTILPRLISGKLRLPEAQTQVEEALV